MKKIIIPKDPKQIGMLVRRCRTALYENQTDFGRRFNVQAAAVSKWEKGKVVPALSILIQAVDLLTAKEKAIARRYNALKR